MHSYSEHWLCLFPQHGPGMKHTRPIALEPWQLEIVARYPGRLLRGLFHSDGCRVTNWTEKRRPRWDMVSVARRAAVARLDEFVGPKC